MLEREKDFRSCIMEWLYRGNMKRKIIFSDEKLSNTIGENDCPIDSF